MPDKRHPLRQLSLCSRASGPDDHRDKPRKPKGGRGLRGPNRFATALAANSVNPATAQKMLGHSDIRMTLAIYTHATDDMQEAATAALEQAFS
jgi:integrase